MQIAALFIWHNKPIMFLVPGISGRASPCESVTPDGHVETCSLKHNATTRGQLQV